MLMPSPKRIVTALSITIACLLAVQVTAVWGPAAAAPRPTSGTGTTTYDSAVLADSPLLYYPLDEAAGPVGDLAGRAGPSTVDTATLGVAGAAGTAASFDGLSQRIEVPYTRAMRLPASFTAEVWAKLPRQPQTDGWPTIFSRGDVEAGHFGAAMWLSADGTHQVHFKRNGIDVGTQQGLTPDRFRHLVYTWDNRARRWSFYVDGALDTTGVLAGLSGTDTEQGPLEIGAMRYSTAGAPFSYGNLLVDGLALYPGVLPTTRIAAHYAAAGESPVSPDPAPTAQPKGYVGGIAVGGLQPWNSRRAADYKALGDAHASWIRSDLGWEYLEPVKGEWRFNLFDPVVADAKAAGLRYLAVLHTVPGWANGGSGDYGPPSDLSLLTNYCYQTARHYLPLGVTEYEIGNEVNLPHPGWTTDAAVYVAKFLKPCVTGVRNAAKEVGVNASIMFGSLAPTDWTGGTNQATYLSDAYANGAAGWFDMLGWHPYTGGDMPSASPHMNSEPGALAAIMARNGDGAKKIWATEYGQATGGPNSVTEKAQSDLVADAVAVWYAKPYAGPMFWFSGRDTGTASDDREQHFGLLHYDGSPKPAYTTLKNLLVR
jgi:polysaccharide biosynthesis protein PslG